MLYHAVRACLITNPKSGRGGVDLSEAVTVLRAHGWEVVVRQKLHGGHATELAQEADANGYNVVVDCGGDGTLNEIIEGVVGTDVAVGTLPGGTANLWAHEVGISRQLRVAALQLIGAVRQRVDVGRVAVNGHHKRHFLLMAGLGFDAAILTHLSKPLKQRVGALAYVPATLASLRTYHGAAIRVEMDDIHWQGRIQQLVVGNTRRYGGFTRITPDAYADDGLLDVSLITSRGPLSLGRQFSALLLRQRPSMASSETYRAASVSIYSPLVLPLQVDGGKIHLEHDELTADGVVYTVSLVTQGATVLVPQTYEGTLFAPAHRADQTRRMPLEPV
ncbi:MAG TPA: diacylglycerol kinase family protein, partial [Ktedonobacterales bacterium]|nr:diacylglycerol kinase family protein [Ktedonobacterales bacterium]